MKKLMLILTAALLALAGRAALPQPDLIAQIHFAGGDKVSADKNYSAFTNEFSSPEALALRKDTAGKLAPWLAGWLQHNLGTTVPDGAAKLRPLFDDLQTAEWFFEARAAVDGSPDVALAIKLDPARMQLWQTSLKPFFPAATFKQSVGWLFFDSGTGPVKAGENFAKKISMPTANWLSLDVNWPHLAQWSPQLKELSLPETRFDVTAPDNNLHINGKFFFPENLALKLDAWQFPSNTVHQPLTSFTAVRGFASWLNGQTWAQPVKLSPPANQLFTWALNGAPFQSFAAVPVTDSGAALPQLGAGLRPVVADRNAQGGFIASFALNVTDDEITLPTMPFLTPYIRAVNEPGGQFLFAGGFPNSPLLPKHKPLPVELFQSLAIPDLIFYHWEITAERMSTLLQVSQFSLMLTRHKQIDTSSAAFQWVNKISATLGNSVTEITQAAPDQLAFVRTAPGGLTAFEFLVLAGWLEAADFPHCNLGLPPISERLKKMQEQNLNRQMLSTPPH